MLTETKLDEYDQIDIPNFVVISKVRKYKKRASGGAAILVRSSIINEIQHLEVNCDDYSKEYFGKTVVLGLVEENVSVCILGDLNARTGTLDDCLSIDGEHDEINDADITHRRLMNLNSTAENKKMTFSEKNIVNNHGQRLIDMCKSLGLYIMNGRCGLDRDVGMLTCKNSSVVDYAISTPDLFNDVIGFQIRDFV